MTRRAAKTLGPILVDPAPLLALRAMIDQVLAGATSATEPCLVLELELHGSYGNRFDKKPWVAELVLTAHGFQRAFLRGRRDYTDADKKGRGVREQFILRPGCVYEVQRVSSKGIVSRNMYRVVDGTLEILHREGLQAWADGLHFAELR